jgi:predicted amidohydrolase
MWRWEKGGTPKPSFGGRLVNVATAEIYPADVAIKGRIAAVGDVAYTKGPSTRIIDATGRFITPAWLRPLAPVSQLSRRHRICWGPSEPGVTATADAFTGRNRGRGAGGALFQRGI